MISTTKKPPRLKLTERMEQSGWVAPALDPNDEVLRDFDKPYSEAKYQRDLNAFLRGEPRAVAPIRRSPRSRSRRRHTTHRAKATSSSDGGSSDSDPDSDLVASSPAAALLLEALHDPAVIAEIGRIARAAVERQLVDAASADAERLLTVAEAAAVLGMTLGAVRQRIARGSLPTIRFGRTVRLKKSELTGVEK